MSWFCETCNDDHPGRFAFCPVTGTPRSSSGPATEKVGSSSPAAPASLVLLEPPRLNTPDVIIRLLETALREARAGHVAFAVLAYGIHNSPAPVLHYWIRANGSDALAAIASCAALSSTIISQNLTRGDLP